MTRRPHGLMVALTTPFDSATGEIAPVSLRANARALIEMGVDGLLAAGSTGEAALLSDDEYRQKVAWLRDVVPADRFLLAGAGRESTRATVLACRAATDEGADFALVRAPAYYGSTLSATAMVAHFRRVADESPIPLLIYNIPKYAHVALADTLLATLADHPNIAGAKDSSGDIKNFAAYRSAVPDWALFVGSAALYYAALEMGAVGGIIAAGCYAAPLAIQVRDAVARNDKAAAGAAQEILGPLHKDIVTSLGVPGVKVAMDVVGLVGGPVRPPLEDLSSRDRAKVADLLKHAGLKAGAVHSH